MAAGLLVLGVLLLAIAAASRVQRMPMNLLVGMRTRATLRSRAAWDAGHSAAAVELGYLGIGCLIAGVVSLAAGSLVADAAWIVVLVAVLHAGAVADRAARAVPDEQDQ